MEKIYDIVVWGASGFTGRLAVDYIYQFIPLFVK